MQQYLLQIDKLSTWVGKTFSWCVLILTFVTVYDVMARYVFNSPTGWAYDTEYILYGTLFMMAGAYAVSQNAHVRGRFRLAHAFRSAPRPRSSSFCTCCSTFPGCWRCFTRGTTSSTCRIWPTSTALPVRRARPIWPFKGVIPLAAFFLILQGIVEVMRSSSALRTGDVAAAPSRRRGTGEEDSR